MSTRRELLIALGAGALTSPFRSFAQQQGKVWCVGLFHVGLDHVPWQKVRIPNGPILVIGVILYAPTTHDRDYTLEKGGKTVVF